MSELNKINEQQLDEVAGGASGNNIKHVYNLKSGYLAVRTAPAYAYENEIGKLYNGDAVRIAGPYSPGTGINGTPATYAYITVVSTGLTGYVNNAYLA